MEEVSSMTEPVQAVQEAPSLFSYITSIGALGPIVWGASEIVGRGLKVLKSLKEAKWPKLACGIAFGMFFGVAAQRVGFLPTAPDASGVWVTIFAAIMGLGGTGVAIGGNQIIAKPLEALLSKRKPKKGLPD
jgi:hypothetical protein